jgi:hypothetical protein
MHLVLQPLLLPIVDRPCEKANIINRHATAKNGKEHPNLPFGKKVMLSKGAGSWAIKVNTFGSASYRDAHVSNRSI